jgi:hypothetical protein
MIHSRETLFLSISQYIQYTSTINDRPINNPIYSKRKQLTATERETAKRQEQEQQRQFSHTIHSIANVQIRSQLSTEEYNIAHMISYATTTKRRSSFELLTLVLVMAMATMMFSGKIPRTCAFRGSPSARSITATTTSSRSSSIFFQHTTTTGTTTSRNHYNQRTAASASIYEYNRGYTNTRSSQLYATKTSSASDESAISKSRVPFRMPKNSADDSDSTSEYDINNPGTSTATTTLSWNRLGLLTEICSCLQDELKLPMPTQVQSLVIPQLLKTEKESIAFLAATGYVKKKLDKTKQKQKTGTLFLLVVLLILI